MIMILSTYIYIVFLGSGGAEESCVRSYRLWAGWEGGGGGGATTGVYLRPFIFTETQEFRVEWDIHMQWVIVGRVKTECDGTRAETRFDLPAKWTSPFISAGLSVQSSTGFLGVRVKLKTAGYPLHSPLSTSLLLPCVAVCHQIPFPLYVTF